MRDFRRPASDYLALELEAHGILADVPLRDVSCVELKGGGPGRDMRDVRRIFVESRDSAGRAVSALFALRGALGRVFGWDREDREHPEESYLHRLPGDVAHRSLVAPGTREGPFRVLYVLPNEALAEVRNSTVHAFSCTSLEPKGDGYRLFWAIHVKPVSWLSRPYMALIEPFRRFVVYPALLRGIERAWREAHA